MRDPRPSDEHGAASRLRAAMAQATAGLVEREPLAQVIALGAVAGEHVLVLGPPGTAKSQAVRQLAEAVSGRYFEYLLGRFTEPSEIFGAVDLKKLREGTVEIATTGMLPEAEIAFLDEVFLGSTAILNTLLALLNERRFRRGHTEVSVPLRVCVGAANELPGDETLAAFADRFLLRCYVMPVPDARLEELLAQGWSLERRERALAAATLAGPAASIADIDHLAARARAADMTEVRPHLASAVRALRSAGVALSDRRIVKLQCLIAAAAVLDGRDSPTARDLWPIVYAVPTAEGQAQARDVLRDALALSESRSLGAAAEDASHGPLARATRLAETGKALLGSVGSADPEATAHHIESVLREIDAGFAPAAMPAALAEVRAELRAVLPTLRSS